MSIKEASYHLPVVLPERYIETLSSGANQPILISGIEEQTQNSDDFVVKLMAGERMDASACFKELLACFMAMEMEIPVVEPVVVNIEQDFVETLLGQDCYHRVQNSIGLNIGSRYVKGFQVTPVGQVLNNHQIEYAKNIFWFDMLIQNPDRTITKPNMFTDGRQIVIFDHELAFSFLMIIGGDSNPWEVTREKWPEWNNLILPRKLNGQAFDEDNISEKISKIDEDFWERAHQLIPAQWMQEEHFERIRNHITSIQDHSDEFIQHIQNLVL